jgi:hypothetical protein
MRDKDMTKKTDVAFVAKKLDKHFKIDKQTKRLMDLSSFPVAPKLNAQEQAALKENEGITLETLTRADFKSLFIKGQLSEADSRHSGLNDPLWKPKKHKEEAAEDSEGGAGASAPGSKSRKGKKAPKMRAAIQESATPVDTKNS